MTDEQYAAFMLAHLVPQRHIDDVLEVRAPKERAARRQWLIWQATAVTGKSTDFIEAWIHPLNVILRAMQAAKDVSVADHEVGHIQADALLVETIEYLNTYQLETEAELIDKLVLAILEAYNEVVKKYS